MQVITDPMTGRSKGFGFCRFGDEAERDRAIVEMAGHFINNRPIRVSTATAKKAPSSTFPPNASDSETLHPFSHLHVFELSSNCGYTHKAVSAISCIRGCEVRSLHAGWDEEIPAFHHLRNRI